MARSIAATAFTALVALVAWLAVLLQYVLIIEVTRDTIGPVLATLRFVSFFTILSNVLVASTTTFALLGDASSTGRFFATPRIRGGVALCIIITGLIYFLVLSSTWAPQGLQWLVDVSLHYAVPVLYVGWWIACVRHGALGWTDPLRWVAFAAVYLAWTLLRGAWLHEYPYPFVDVGELGIGRVLVNSVGLGLVFIGFGLLLVALDRVLSRRA